MRALCIAIVLLAGSGCVAGGEISYTASASSEPPVPFGEASSDDYVWVRSGWVQRDGRYVFVHGRWARRGHATRYRYVHPGPRVRVRPGARYRTRRRR